VVKQTVSIKFIKQSDCDLKQYRKKFHFKNLYRFFISKIHSFIFHISFTINIVSNSYMVLYFKMSNFFIFAV